MEAAPRGVCALTCSLMDADAARNTVCTPSVTNDTSSASMAADLQLRRVLQIQQPRLYRTVDRTVQLTVTSERSQQPHSAELCMMCRARHEHPTPAHFPGDVNNVATEPAICQALVTTNTWALNKRVTRPGPMRRSPRMGSRI